MPDLRCRCTWLKILKNPICSNLATQEDGLCDFCRCPHGCCEDHEGIMATLQCMIEMSKVPPHEPSLEA